MSRVSASSPSRSAPVVRKRRRRYGGNSAPLWIRKVNFTERAANREARARIARLLSDDLVDTVTLFRRSIDLPAVGEALVTGGDIAFAEEAIGLGEMQARMASQVLDRMNDAIGEGGQLGLRFAPAQLEGVSPLLVNEAAASWVSRVGGDAVAGITERSGAAVRRVLLESLADQISPTQAARRIGDVMGLTEQQTVTLGNFRARIEAQLIPVAEAETIATRAAIERRVAAESARLVRVRGAAIAETEMQAAIQEGERLFWQVAGDQGAVDLETVFKTWFTVDDGDVCEICMPMHGIEVLQDEVFESPEGWIGDAPPAHPRCRCYLEYEIRAEEISV